MQGERKVQAHVQVRLAAFPHARGWLLAFSQDDRLPPSGTQWVDATLEAFALMPASFAALGLHRGSLRTWRSLHGEARMVGSCGDAADDQVGGRWLRFSTIAMERSSYD